MKDPYKYIDSIPFKEEVERDRETFKVLFIIIGLIAFLFAICQTYLYVTGITTTLF